MEPIIEPRTHAQAFLENFIYDQTGKNFRLDHFSTPLVHALAEAIWKVQNPKVEAYGALDRVGSKLVKHHDEEQIND